MTYAKTILASASLLLVSQTAHAEVVINELFKGASGAGEYVELYNNGDEPVDISGWKLETATTNFAVKATIPADTTLESHAYWVIAKPGVLAVDAGADAGAAGQSDLTGNLPAASETADAIRIKNGDTVVDTVIWGAPKPNSDSFTDDTGAVAASIAPKPVNGQSVGRKPNGVDTNQCATDFAITPVGQQTPGAANYEAPPVPDGGTSSSSSGSSGNTSSSSSSGGTSSSSSSSGGKSSSSSSSGGKSSSSGKFSEGDDDDDNSNLTADDGGCNASAGTPMSMLLGLGALFLMRRRRQTHPHSN